MEGLIRLRWIFQDFQLSQDLIFDNMRVSLITVVLLCFISSCKDWDYPQQFPIVFTDEIQNINSEGAELVGNVESLGSGQNIISYGFAWSESEKPTLNSSHVLISEKIQKGRFVKIINKDLPAGTRYYVRAFIQTTTLIIYGNQVTFTSRGSLPPVITDFTPKEGFDGTEITIEGQNFSSTVEGNIVMLGALPCRVISATDSSVKIKSPTTKFIQDYSLSITVAGKTVVSETEFSILGPRINSISKLSGRVGDLLTMEGEYFDNNYYLSISFGVPAQGIFNLSYPYILSADQLECYVPEHPNSSGKIQLYSFLNFGQKEFDSPYNFTIVNSWQKISDVTPLQQYRDGVRHSSAVIGNSVFVVGGKTLFEFNTITKAWTKRQDFPGAYRYYGTSFSFNGKLYYGFGAGYYPDPACCGNGQDYNDLWVFDPESNQWSFVMDTPLPETSRQKAVVINNKAYIGFGQNTDLWEFDIINNTWTQVETPFAVGDVSTSTAFSIGNKAYFVGVTFSGISPDTWEFEPAIGSWSKKSNYPDIIYGENATTMNNHGLVISSAVNDSRSRVYEYDPIKDRWIKRQSMSGTTAPIQFSHYVNGVLYYSSGNLWGLTFN
jgi:hypothetical protein